MPNNTPNYTVKFHDLAKVLGNVFSFLLIGDKLMR